MRKLTFAVPFLTALLLLLTGCNSQTAQIAEKPLIITTIYPYEMVVRQLVDTLFTVQTLMPPNASPHTWSPGPQDVLKIKKADVIISNGLGLETNLEKALTASLNRLITVSDFVDKTKLINDDEFSNDSKPDKSKISNWQPNPHIWTSPDLLTDIIIGLTQELGKRYPMLKLKLQSNARLMIMELNQVDGKIKTQMQNYDRPSIITLHDAFVYFFKYYRINYLGSVQPIGGKDPSPRDLKELADKIKAYKIKAIFIEPRMNPKPAKTLANELKLQVLTYDDLGTTLKAKTISSFIWQNWLAIKAGL